MAGFSAFVEDRQDEDREFHGENTENGAISPPGLSDQECELKLSSPLTGIRTWCLSE